VKQFIVSPIVMFFVSYCSKLQFHHMKLKSAKPTVLSIQGRFVVVVVVLVNRPGNVNNLGSVLGQVEGRDLGSVVVVT